MMYVIVQSQFQYYFSGLDIWKKTYGFDWADWIPGHGPSGHADFFKLKEHCLREEYGTYAQSCKKDGGFFKCGGLA